MIDRSPPDAEGNERDSNAGTDMLARTRGGHSFAINGRFLGQPVTGVQRYASEVTHGIDELLAQAGIRGLLLTPAVDDASSTRYQAIDVTRIGPLDGYLWEQLVLPLRCDMPILNLCNTGPAATRKQVVCIHDANVFVQPASYRPLFRAAYHTLLPQLARRAARVTTVSKASALQLASFLPIAARDIDVLPNGHEHVRRWNAAASALATRWHASRPFVLLLGSRARHKNSQLILTQADALDAMGLDLVVAGGGSGIFSPSAAISRSNIRHLGVVSDDDLAFLYSRALCLAFPSFTEGFGLPIVEAMALDCPVISSDRASMPEVCGSAALLAAPDDPQAWLDQIKTVASSRSLQDDLRGRGREQVKQFSWTASARAYLDLMETTQ